MTELHCKYCGRQAIMASRGDMLLVGPCAGCGASEYAMRQVFSQPEPSYQPARWMSTGSGMQPDIIDQWRGPLVMPRLVALEYTIR